jgi:hypothetical protein
MGAPSSPSQPSSAFFLRASLSPSRLRVAPLSPPLLPQPHSAHRRAAAPTPVRAAATDDAAAPVPGLATAKSGNSFKPLQDIEAIQQILPHRFPFLLVDRVVELEPQAYAVGYKNVTANDNFFTGHFPDRKIMPGECFLLRLCGEKRVFARPPITPPPTTSQKHAHTHTKQQASSRSRPWPSWAASS